MAFEIKDIDESKAPLIDHLIELRSRLMRSIAALIIAFCVCLYFVDPIFGFLVQPLRDAFPAGEGQAYFVGGLNASYLRRGDVVLIPIRVGAGLRLGINAGYMKFSKEQKWSPF